MGSEASKSRRTFLAALVGVGSAVIGLVLAVPGAAYVIDPLLRTTGKKGRWVRVAKVDSLSEDEPVAVPVIGEQTDAWTRQDNVRMGMVWLRKKGDKVTALNAECPHLGCKVAYVAESKNFGCPCHTSAFAADGKRLSGPAPRGMDPLDVRVTDGNIEVHFIRYRAQTEERIEVS